MRHGSVQLSGNEGQKNLEAAEVALSCDCFIKAFPVGDARRAVDTASGA